MEKRWFVRAPQDSTIVEEFRSELKVDSVVAELLLQRGIDSYPKAEAFFRPKLEHLHDPFLMKDMQKAVDRIELAIVKKEKVLLSQTEKSACKSGEAYQYWCGLTDE